MWRASGEWRSEAGGAARDAGYAYVPAAPPAPPTDTDVSYAVKPVWDSYLEYIEQNDADGAWQSEQPSERVVTLRALPCAAARMCRGSRGCVC